MPPVPVGVFIDEAKASEWDRPCSRSWLKCLGFLLPNKLIADTLVSSCADCLSREGLAFQTGSAIILWELGVWGEKAT